MPSQDPEQSRRAAEPLPSLSPKELIRNLGLEEAAQPEEELSDEAKENRLRAAKEISLIFELHNSRAFEWFEKEFIDKPYWEARRKLMGWVSDFKPGELEKTQVTYAALKQVKVGMLEREIAHREQINPNDEQIAILREKLALL